MSSGSNELCLADACDLARLIRQRAVSAREVMSAHLEQIARVNPAINAIVGKLPDEECLRRAADADRRLSAGEPVGPLHGLPMAFKDFEPAAGLPHTLGSPIFSRRIATSDSVLVERLRSAGVIPIGKTNISEFTMGSHTYNRVYGTTRNPYDLTKSAGGSSGGAAAAVSAGLLPLADGSDLGGSLRNPASFNNLVALRPTVGLVPNAPTPFPLIELLAKGPIARTVADAALMLGAIAGPDPRDPRTFPVDAASFHGGLERDFSGTRIAWCPDLGGLPLDARVRAVIEPHRRTLVDLGASVEDAVPDFPHADDVFLTLRCWMSAHVLGPLLAQHRHEMKPEAIWQIERGQRITASEVATALCRHAELLEAFRRFQERHEFLVCAVSQMPPFDAALAWPSSVDGVPMAHYIDWMKSAYWISLTLCPAASVPAGFTDEGLPVGIQIVGRPRADVGVLQLARAFERATGYGRRRPAIALPPVS